MFFRSPIPASSKVMGAMSLSTGTDSPVSAASSTFRELASSKRISAGTISPASKSTISPGTSSWDLMVSTLPFRRTLASGEAISFKASMASSALASWMTPMIAFKTTTKRIITASCHSWLAKRDTVAAAKRMIIIKSLNCSINFSNREECFSTSRALLPYSACLLATSAEESPVSTGLSTALSSWAISI